MAVRRALICGITGQDGAYLARLLLDEHYEVFGTSRDAHNASLHRLASLGIGDRVRLLSMAVGDLGNVVGVLKATQPHEIYNLSGQSSVGLSFEQPLETFQSIAVGTLNLLEAIRALGLRCRYYNAADETTPFRPRSPYAVAKSAAFFEVTNYREAYGQFACSGILFNHESPLRPERYVTQKVVAAASRIHAGSREKLALGNLDVSRDWGWAPEYVRAMWLMLQQREARDYVIATGETRSLRDFVSLTFGRLGLDWEQHVVFDPRQTRPYDIEVSRANPAYAARELGWVASRKLEGVVDGMLAGFRVR